jgi:hypothetical protein
MASFALPDPNYLQTPAIQLPDSYTYHGVAYSTEWMVSVCFASDSSPLWRHDEGEFTWSNAGDITVGPDPFSSLRGFYEYTLDGVRDYMGGRRFHTGGLVGKLLFPAVFGDFWKEVDISTGDVRPAQQPAFDEAHRHFLQRSGWRGFGYEYVICQAVAGQTSNDGKRWLWLGHHGDHVTQTGRNPWGHWVKTDAAMVHLRTDDVAEAIAFVEGIPDL